MGARDPADSSLLGQENIGTSLRDDRQFTRCQAGSTNCTLVRNFQGRHWSKLVSQKLISIVASICSNHTNHGII